MKVEIRFFGGFKDFGEGVTVEVPKNSAIAYLRLALLEKLGESSKTLIEDSAFASEDQILGDDFALEFVEKEPVRLFILPPVCGG